MALPSCLRCSQRQFTCLYSTRSSRDQQPAKCSADSMPGLLIEDPTCMSPSVVAQLGESSDGFDSASATIDSGFGDLTPLEFPVDDGTFGFMQYTTLTAPSTKALDTYPEMIANRLQWSIDEIRKAPSMMVLENQTPWCHPALYKDGMPRSMQNAHACCALYLAKNRVNAPIIFRSIESYVNDLLCSPAPDTPRDCVAHTQSLLLYEIIRLFDGDIGARACAERDLGAVETSAIALFAHAKFDLDPASKEMPMFPIAPTKTFWLDWVLQESIRRTLLLTFYFLQAYRILTRQKGLQCDGKLGLCHSWTVSAHLWGARSPLAFAEAWKSRKHFVVTNAVFNEMLEEATADDVDTYGKIFITSLMGIDEAEGWFASRGGSL
ncbi:hypothetical protein QQZ08_007701 [Neonectria magnoliae]|uniref:Uncharacterized protein n=1 Tax=Neonectria magnoliae TaxID=2732573 RepID=A0ABR1HZ30_9HYPO